MRSCFFSTSARASSSAREYIEPVGLDGEQIIRARVCGVMAASSWAGVILKSCSMPALTHTGSPSASFTI